MKLDAPKLVSGPCNSEQSELMVSTIQIVNKMYNIGPYTNSFDGKCNPKKFLDPVQSAHSEQSALMENCGEGA